MSEAISNQPSFSTPHLPPAVQDEVESLALLINETEGGLIAFALYHGAANRLMASSALAEMVQVPVVEIPLSPQDANPLPQIKRLAVDKRYTVFITRLEEALPDVAGMLNLQREIFAELPHAVIFWVTAHGLRQLATLAPDFWAWRSGVFDLRQATQTVMTSDFRPLLDGTPDFRSRADLEKRILLYQDLLQEYQAQTPPDNRFLGDLHHKLAATLRSLGEYQEALIHARQALQLCEQEHGPDHPDVGAALSILCIVLSDLGDLHAAEAACVRSLAIAEKVYGLDYSNVGAALNNLGLILRGLGDFPAAKNNFERALAIDEKIFGPDHPKVATRLNNLGLVLRDLGDFPAAKKNFERALAIDEKIFGPDHHNVANRLNNLGYVLRDQGDLPAARVHYKRSLDICEKSLGPDHPNTKLVRRNLASLNR